MSWKLEVINDLCEVVLHDEPSYIHPLKMAPDAMEPELETGIWLVVAFPVWSGPVRHSVSAAIDCAKHYAGKFHLGIRPFSYHDEINKWWPSGEAPAEGETVVTVKDESHRREVHITSDPSAYPAWLVLKDGRVIHIGAGPRSAEQLREMVHGVVP